MECLPFSLLDAILFYIFFFVSMFNLIAQMYAWISVCVCVYLSILYAYGYVREYIFVFLSVCNGNMSVRKECERICYFWVWVQFTIFASIRAVCCYYCRCCCCCCGEFYCCCCCCCFFINVGIFFQTRLKRKAKKHCTIPK